MLKHIVSIVYTSDQDNFDQEISFRGTSLRLSQYATNFNLDLTLQLLRRYDGICDAISISGLPPAIKTKKGLISHPDRDRLMSATSETEVLDGQTLKEVYIPWVMRKFFLENREIVKNKNTSFYAGLLQKNLVEVIEDSGGKVLLGDLALLLGAPIILKNSQGLENILNFIFPLFKRLKLKRGQLNKLNFSNKEIPKHLLGFMAADIFSGNMATLELLNLEHLKNKIVITDVLSNDMKNKLEGAGVSKIIVSLPQDSGVPFMNFAIFEAILQAFSNEKITIDYILEKIQEFDIGPYILDFKESSKENVTTGYIS